MLHRARTVMTHMSPSSYQAGVVTAAMFAHTFRSGDAAFTAADDVLEIGFLPAGTRPLRATLIGDGFGAQTAEIGFMSGEPGAKTNANGSPRTSGSDLFAAEAVEGETPAAMADLLAIEKAETHRSIGVKLSGDVAPAGQTVWLVIEYVS